MASLKNEIFEYVKKKYDIEAEYLWSRFPGYAIFRHQDNEKWFGLIMDVPSEKLGLPGDQVRDILNVKMSDMFLVDALVQQEGYLRGYHISKGNWVSILLDGTVPLEEICRWLDESFLNTASREIKQKLRPPKEWIIPSNPRYYDVQAAFRESEEINWKQGKGIKAGDTVYMYVAAPVSAILYKCLVTETDMPVHFQHTQVHITHLMRIKLLREYPPEQFTFEKLGREYGINAIRGPRGIPEALSQDLQM